MSSLENAIDTSFKKPFQEIKIKQLYYSPAHKRLFFSWRSGYGYCKLENGKPKISDTEHLINKDSIIGVQCFAQPDGDTNTLYIGTLNDGIYIKNLSKKDLPQSQLQQRFKNITNIIDMVLSNDTIFVLTPVKLYKASLDKDSVYECIDNRSLHICKLHPYHNAQKQAYLLGISQLGGLYKFRQESLSHDKPRPLYPDIIFYPDAIDISANTLTAGTNIGLVEIDMENSDISFLSIIEPWYVRLGDRLQSYMQPLISIGLPAAIALVIIIIALLLLSWWGGEKTKEKLEKLDKKYKEKKNELEQLSEHNRESEEKLNQLNKQNRESEEKLQLLSEQNRESEEKLNQLNKQNRESEEKLKQLGEQNRESEEKLKQSQELLEYIRQHHEIEKITLTSADRLHQDKWSIWHDPLTENLKCYDEYQECMKKRIDLFDKINQLDYLNDKDFHSKLKSFSQEAHRDYFPLLMKVDVFALRVWITKHHKHLMEDYTNDKYVFHFRQEIESIVKRYFTDEYVTKEIGKREEGTFEFYWRMWAAALLLNSPNTASRDKLPTLKKDKTSDNNDPQEIITSIVKKPRNLRPLLCYIVEDNEIRPKEISEDNFNSIKKKLKEDYSILVESINHKELPYEPSFRIVNPNMYEFMIGALDLLYDKYGERRQPLSHYQ